MSDTQQKQTREQLLKEQKRLNAVINRCCPNLGIAIAQFIPKLIVVICAGMACWVLGLVLTRNMSLAFVQKGAALLLCIFGLWISHLMTNLFLPFEELKKYKAAKKRLPELEKELEEAE